MSNTRRQAPGEPLRQERWCSSEEVERGLLANLVARRVSVIEDPKDRELVWALQSWSHQPGGLEKVARDLLTMFRDRLGTRSMQRFGTKPGKVYTVGQIKQIGSEIGKAWPSLQLGGASDWGMEELVSPSPRKRRDEDNSAPSWGVEDILDLPKLQAELASILEELCLNPAVQVRNCQPWFFPELIPSLWEYHDRRASSIRESTVVTAIGGIIHDALSYAAQSKCLVLVEGLARTGKTFAAKQWVADRPGLARYVQVPSTNDDIGFFRAIAKAIGVSCGRAWKAVQLRQRIEDVLQTADLILVMDEAQFCFPVCDCRHSLPGRVNWVLTALVNQGVGVAFISTPQFTATQRAVEKRTHWTSEQLIGRITHYERLPNSLDREDLLNVARALLPEGDSKSLQGLVDYAQGSAKYLAGIESAVRRARYLAQKDGRDKVTAADVRSAIKQGVIPSDAALAQALAEPLKARGRRFKAPLTPPEPAVEIRDRCTIPARSGEPDFADIETPQNGQAVRLAPARRPLAVAAG